MNLKPFLLGIIGLLLLSNTASHDIPIAIFRLTEDSGKLQLLVTIDQEDLSLSTGLKINESAIDDIQGYLQEQSRWIFDNQSYSLKVDSMQTLRKHLHLFAHFESPPQHWKKLVVENNCLIDIRHHSNIIQIEVGEEVRDYRMHRGRTRIEVDF